MTFRLGMIDTFGQAIPSKTQGKFGRAEMVAGFGAALSAAPHRASKGGFTLVELVVVLCILAVLMAAVVPMYAGSLMWARSDRACRGVAALMRYAGEMAIIEETDYRVCFDRDKGTCWAMRRVHSEEMSEEGAAEKEGNVFESLGERRGEAQALPEGIEFGKVKAQYNDEGEFYFIEFRPSGSCDFATVPIIDADGETTRIHLRGSVGTLEIEEP